MATSDSTRISPTAHYTSYVWYQNGLSHPALATSLGRILHGLLTPFNHRSARSNGGLTVETFLLQRHLIIDHLLTGAIESGEVSQVVEVACGLSPRGFTFASKYSDLVYVEADLPDMAAHKRSVLESAGLVGANHKVVALDVLQETGPQSLAGSTREHLRADVGTAIITEGLLNYFDRDSVINIWAQFAHVLREWSGGLYLSDLHLASENPDLLLSKLFKRSIELFTRGKTYLHFDQAHDAADALATAGFSSVQLHRPREFKAVAGLPLVRGEDIVRVIAARV